MEETKSCAGLQNYTVADTVKMVIVIIMANSLCKHKLNIRFMVLDFEKHVNFWLSA